MQNKEALGQKMNNKIMVEDEKNRKMKMTEREKILIMRYRGLCDENKMTIDILIQRLLGQEKGRE